MLFTRRRLIEAANDGSFRNDSVSKSLSSANLREAAMKAKPTDRFDVFLSHARVDEDVVYGAKRELERYGFSVYVDWIVDTQLDRSKVTSETAETLRDRMRQCKGLLYVHSENSDDSRWMPWELGYFDGYAQRAAILPVVEPVINEFKGVEYLGIYPYLDDYVDTAGVKRLWINKPGSRSVYAPLKSWLDDIAEMRDRGPWLP